MNPLHDEDRHAICSTDVLNLTDAHCRFWNNKFLDVAPTPSAANRPPGKVTPSADDIAVHRLGNIVGAAMRPASLIRSPSWGKQLA